MPKPTPEHEWLKQLVGDWKMTGEHPCMETGPIPFEGSERGRALGDVWVVLEGRTPMPDGSAGDTLMTLGYEPETGRFTGTWIGAMMTRLWVYEDGRLDEAARCLHLESDGPGFSGEGISRYRDTIELIGPDERLLRSSHRDENGEWQEFMKVRYQRV